MIPGGLAMPFVFSNARSLRFTAASTMYAERTPAGAGDRKTWTFSCFVKRASIGAIHFMLSARSTVGTYAACYFNSSNVLIYSDSSAAITLISTATYTSTANYYHVVVATDTTQATAANRCRIYVDGSQVTSFSTETYCAQNADTNVSATVKHTLGGSYDTTTPYAGMLNGYLDEVCLIGGQQLTPAHFAANNKPIDLSYLAPGTNGFWLRAEDNASTTSMGYDELGGNDFTLYNMSTSDSSTDVP